MIGITTPTFDLDGFLMLRLRPESSFENLSRRVSSVKTLDGGTEIIDSGFSDSDTIFSIAVDTISITGITNLKRMMQTYPILHFATKQGSFSGVISDLNTDNMPIKFTVQVEKKHAD